MNPLLRMLLTRYMAPAGDDGADTGGTDVLDQPDGSQDEGAQPEDRGDVVDPALTPENLRAVVKAAGEDEGEEGAEGDDDSGQRFQGIPKARFNEVNERRKALESENEELRRQLAERSAPAPAAASAAPAPAEQQPFDVDAKEQEYAAALIEGDTAKAGKIRKEINAHIISEAEARADAKVEARSQQQLLKDEVALTLKDHPWLNEPDGADALDLIVAKRDAEIARGKAPHLALREAVAKIAPRFAPPAEKAPPVGVEADQKAKDTRAIKANERGAADSLKQPASLGGAGVGGRASGGQPDVESMTDEQFEALSEAEKSRLRGD
ncbi:MAG: hypothetical protein WA955_15640 [Diaphorobacter nitroreducens]|uniref:hypothetical protein n=1 Tax=Diaphorobacter nitroreducens TaxID=164759 RepID=UPI003C774276